MLLYLPFLFKYKSYLLLPGTEGPVDWSKNEDLCSLETEKLPKKSVCSKASTKIFVS